MKKNIRWFIIIVVLILAIAVGVSCVSLITVETPSDFETQRFFVLIEIFSNVAIVGAIGILMQQTLIEDHIEGSPLTTRVIISDEKSNTEIKINGKITNIEIKNIE